MTKQVNFLVGRRDLRRTTWRERPLPEALEPGQVLLAVDATFELGSAAGERSVAAHDFWTGYRETALRDDELLLRAAGTVLGPLGVTETTLRDWLFSRAAYSAPPGQVPPKGLPLLVHRENRQPQMPKKLSSHLVTVHGH